MDPSGKDETEKHSVVQFDVPDRGALYTPLYAPAQPGLLPESSQPSPTRESDGSPGSRKLQVNVMGRLAMAEAKAASLTSQVQVMDVELTVTKQRVVMVEKEKKDETGKLEQELEEARARIKALEIELECFAAAKAARLESEANSKEELVQMIGELKAKAHRLQLEKEEGQRLVEEAESRVATAERELEEERAKHADVTRDLREELARMKEEYTAERQKLSEALMMAEKKSQAVFERATTSRTIQHEEESVHEKEAQVLRETVDLLRTELAELKEQYKELSNENGEMEEALLEAEENEQMLVNAREQESLAREQAEQLVRELEEQLDALRQKYRELENSGRAFGPTVSLLIQRSRRISFSDREHAAVTGMLQELRNLAEENTKALWRAMCSRLTLERIQKKVEAAPKLLPGEYFCFTCQKLTALATGKRCKACVECGIAPFSGTPEEYRHWQEQLQKWVNRRCQVMVTQRAVTA
eukprot:Hpha_TRINITY_DN16769_c0_g1::TRINITY_DN16769_c0_g1_i1::g.76946::m.76946